jgi:hypothetical protein
VLSYDVSWSTYLTAGSATLSVKEWNGIGGGSVYDLVAEGRPTNLLDKLYHLYYKAESLLHRGTLRSTMATIYSDERGRSKLRTTRFNGRTIEFRPLASGPWEKRAAPALAQDPLSAIYVVRSLPLQAGHAFTMPIVDGRDIYHSRWQVAGPETIRTAAGSLPAWRLTPTLTSPEGKLLTNYRITMWVSNDARRLPLKLEAGLTVGNFVLTLTKVSG